MSDCFVSYKREDRSRVEPLVSALRAAGVSVWWDQDIGGGERWRETIVEQLDAARCVVVCWTHASTGPDGAYVREEAERAKTRGVLPPVRLDGVYLTRCAPQTLRTRKPPDLMSARDGRGSLFSPTVSVSRGWPA